MLSPLIFETNDARFARYRVQANRNVGDYVRASKLYIEAHSDPEAIALDGSFCRSVGGHIHIAAVDPILGFYWFKGYEPIAK